MVETPTLQVSHKWNRKSNNFSYFLALNICLFLWLLNVDDFENEVDAESSHFLETIGVWTAWRGVAGLVIGHRDVIFFAANSSRQSGFQDPVIFERDLINPGGHYSSSTGQFTAPCDGIYQFSVSIQYSSYVLVDLYIDNALVYDDPRAGSYNYYRAYTVLQELTTGQTVHVVVDSSSGVEGDPRYIESYFAGHLIQAN